MLNRSNRMEASGQSAPNILQATPIDADHWLCGPREINAGEKSESRLCRGPSCSPRDCLIKEMPSSADGERHPSTSAPALDMPKFQGEPEQESFWSPDLAPSRAMRPTRRFPPFENSERRLVLAHAGLAILASRILRPFAGED